uniref:Alternative protein PTPRT n=1 Tax=Homo sapiens TaxID=9606 RepID=L8ECM4_HUMAN|nr:alternative protein PTPRT [Homo sapiens]
MGFCMALTIEMSCRDQASLLHPTCPPPEEMGKGHQRAFTN